MKFIPHPYQRDTIDRLIEEQEVFLALDMGLGKTVTVLTAIEQLIKDEAIKVLIVAPLRVARMTWPIELRTWDHLKWLKYEILHGPKKAEALKQDAHIYLINYEGLAWLSEQELPDFDMVVWDESSKMKTPGSQRFKKWRYKVGRFRRRVAMSATPVAEGLLGLWAQVFLVDGGKRLGSSYTRYKNAHFYPDYMGYTWTIRQGAEDSIRSKVEDIFIRYSKDILSLPPLVIEDVELSLPKDLWSQYQELEKKMFLELDEGDVTALSAAAKLNKCRQFAAGIVYTDGTPAEVHRIKLEALKKIAKETDSPLLVGYAFRTEAERILKEFPEAVHLKSGLSTAKERQIQRDWDAGRIPMLVCHPASAGHGLNLQRGSHTAVWSTLEWSGELYEQFNGRIHRQGQEHPVTIKRLVMKDTVDDMVATAVDTKKETQDSMLASLCRYREVKGY